MHYSIFDRDVFNNSGIFILSGPHYYALLKICIDYSFCFSLYPCQLDRKLETELSRWRIPSPFENTPKDTSLLFYESCKETYHLLTEITHSLFDFEDQSNKYANDIIFYRHDGTVFMETLVHEGECSIYPRTDENVDTLLSFGNWISINEAGDLDAPAAEHQLFPPLFSDVIEDPFYILLQEIQKNPENYLSSVTVETLEQFICAYNPLGILAKNSGTKPKISTLPYWYIAFKTFVLGKYNCSTATPIAEAICSNTPDGLCGYFRFFELLDEYLQSVCRTGDGSRTGRRTGDGSLS